MVKIELDVEEEGAIPQTESSEAQQNHAGTKVSDGLTGTPHNEPKRHNPTPPSASGLPREKMLAVSRHFMKSYDVEDPYQWQVVSSYIRNKGVPDDIIEEAKNIAIAEKRGESLTNSNASASATPSKEQQAKPEEPDAPSENHFSRHHAPQFQSLQSDGSKLGDEKNTPSPEFDAFAHNNTAVVNEEYQPIDCEGSLGYLVMDGSAASGGGGGKNKKKQSKQEGKKKLQSTMDAISSRLDADGFVVLKSVCSRELITKARQEMRGVEASYAASEIFVGKEGTGVGAHLHVPSVRGDKVMWVCGGHSYGSAYKSRGVVKVCPNQNESKPELKDGGVARVDPAHMNVEFQAIRKVSQMVDLLVLQHLRPKVAFLKTAYERSECHLAMFPGKGTRFQRHVDNTTKDGRVLTCVLYLNPDWDSANGGAVRLFPPNDPQGRVVDVFPEAGTLVIFKAADMPHEVLPTMAERHALTLWYYDIKETAEMLKASPANIGADEKGAKKPVEEEQARIQAKEFIETMLMGVDREDPTKSKPPTEGFIALLAEKAEQLCDGAAQILSSITGVGSGEEFVSGVHALTPESLTTLRHDMCKMGIS